MGDAAPAPKHRPEQEAGDMAGDMVGKGIQQEEHQGRQKQVTGIHFDFDSGLSVETTRTTVNPPGHQ